MWAGLVSCGRGLCNVGGVGFMLVGMGLWCGAGPALCEWCVD